MSNYSAPTRHPITGAIEMADWLDDSFGRHIYGVRFHGEEKIYPSTDCVEMGLNEMLAEIERLREGLLVYGSHYSACNRYIGQECNCGFAASLGVKTHAALEGGETDD